jgi:hypothetical protein
MGDVLLKITLKELMVAALLPIVVLCWTALKLQQG